MPDSLAETFRAARAEFIKATRTLHRRWAKRGIDWQQVAVADESDFKPGVEPPPGILLTSDPDFRRYHPYQQRYQSVRDIIKERQPDRWDTYRAWEEDWYYRFPAGIKGRLAKQYAREFEEHLRSICEDPIPVPPGWEGDRPDEEIKDLAGLERWLNGLLSFLRRFHEIHRPNLFQGRGVQLAQIAVRNFYRCLDHLQVSPRPPRPADTDEGLRLEAALSDLLAWVRERRAVESQHPEVDRSPQEPPMDESAYVSAVQVWRGRYKSYKLFRRDFRKIEHRVRSKHRGMHLYIHAGDWIRHHAETDLKKFNALDRDAAFVDQVLELDQRKSQIAKKRQPAVRNLLPGLLPVQGERSAE